MEDTLKTLTLFAILIVNSSFARKNCKINLISKSFLKKITSLDVIKRAKSLSEKSDIELVKNNSDFTVKVMAMNHIDYHNSNYSMVSYHISIWPSHLPEMRSSIVETFETNYLKNRRLTNRRLFKILDKGLSRFLKSCEDASNIIKKSGSGTLDLSKIDYYTSGLGYRFVRENDEWIDPSGLHWLDTLDGEYKNTEAAAACFERNARVPTQQDYKRLLSYFEMSKNKERLSKKGLFELNSLFPWSYSFFIVAPENGINRFFFQNTGSFGNSLEHWKLNLRCVK